MLHKSRDHSGIDTDQSLVFHALLTGGIHMYCIYVFCFCSKRSMVYACSKCESYHLQPLGKCLEDASS